jgi:hypothetical protein
MAPTQPGQLLTTPIPAGSLFGIDTGSPQVSSAKIGQGTFVCNGATPVVVADANVTANSIIIATLKTIGGTVGAIPAVTSITPGVGFSVTGTAGDSSTYNYLRIA